MLQPRLRSHPFGPTLPVLLALTSVACSGPREATGGSGGGSEPLATTARPDTEAIAAAQALAVPGPEHEQLGKLAGTWAASSTLRVTPEAEAVVEQSTIVGRTLLGGRFVELAAEGSMFGQPIESRTILGYDRRRECYTLVGLDTMGTYWVTAEGQRAEDGVIRMHGRDPDPTGEQVYRFELELNGPDRFELRVVFLELGQAVFDPPFTVVATEAERVGG